MWIEETGTSMLLTMQIFLRVAYNRMLWNCARVNSLRCEGSSDSSSMAGTFCSLRLVRGEDDVSRVVLYSSRIACWFADGPTLSFLGLQTLIINKDCSPNSIEYSIR